MKNVVLFFLVFGLLLEQARASEIAKDFKSEIENSGLSKSISVYVADSETNKVIFSHRENELRNPASLTKLLTTGAVLSRFEPGKKFRTELLVNGSVDKQKLSGSLVLKGGGDPGFVSETMWFLVNEFLRSGIRNIDGDIIVDDTKFDGLRFDPSRQKERVDRAYDAPVGAMSFNWNSANVYARPGEKSGDKAIVIVDPENSMIDVDNNVKTNSSTIAEIEVDRTEIEKGRNKFRVRGSIGLKVKEKVVFVSITEPAIWAGENLKEFLKQRGVSVSGTIKIGKTPVTAKAVAFADSKSIELVIADMNKFSNNFVAEMLTKNLSADFGTKTSLADLPTGVKLIANWLESLGLKSGDDFIIENPSGLTRNNRISAISMWKILKVMKNDFTSQPEIFSSLPIAGVDGTLKNRLKSNPRGVRAKTGLLDGVVGLAGYSGNETKVIPFVMIFNGNADESRVRSLFDRLALRLSRD